MNGYEFCCWFQGVLDMHPEGLSAAQITKINEKLKTVKSPDQLMAEAAQPTTAAPTEKLGRPRC